MANPRIQSIIDLRADEHKQNEAAWRRNERRFAAGEDVYDELRKFSYEKGPQPNAASKGEEERQAETEGRSRGGGNLTAYRERQERAVWPEFSQLVVEKFVGLVFGQYPQIEFGPLETKDSGWRAEEIQKDADGVGPNARSLFAFFFDAMARAMATKKRWILAEGAVGGAASVQDERDGQRPYLVEYSPLQVPYYRFERGVLQAARIEYTESILEVGAGGKVGEESRKVHYVMTREGFAGFGTIEAGRQGVPFEDGGWWQFDDEGEIIERDGEPMRGDWSATGGEIPLCLLYYERASSKENRRTGITNLGRLEVNWMDQFSALMNHAWESGSASTAFTGVSKDQWDVIHGAGQTNAKWFPVPADPNGNGKVGVEKVNGGEKPEAITAALEQILKQVMVVVARELTTSANASGRSREVQHLKNNAPRLTNMAGNVEEAMTTALNFLSLRWVGEKGVSLEWKKQFDLKTVAERVSEVFALFTEIDAQAPELFADLLVRAAESEGLLPEDTESDDLKNEIRDAVGLEQRRKEAEVARTEESVAADRLFRQQGGGVGARMEQQRAAAGDSSEANEDES